MAETMLLGLLIALAWFWMDSIAKREIAIKIGRQLAERCHLQFLDETVACSRLRFARDGNGRMQLQRTYTFDVSSQGVERMAAHLQLRGGLLVAWHIPPYATQ
jgi:Protein of unknown function (DUF3301)